MKIDLQPARPGDPPHHLRFHLRPENRAEMHWLTTLRDVAMNAKTQIRVVGAEALGRNVVGLPNRPVAALSLELTHAEPRRENTLDPNRPVHDRTGDLKKTVGDALNLVALGRRPAALDRSGDDASAVLE